VTWASAKKKSELVNGGHIAFPQNSGFFRRHMRSLSNSLPRFNLGSSHSYAEKEKLGRGRWVARDGTIVGRARNLLIKSYRKSRIRFMITLVFIFALLIYWFTRKFPDLEGFFIAKIGSCTILVAQSAILGRR
jgi:mannan polymerase II complex MNN10 subunit